MLHLGIVHVHKLFIRRLAMWVLHFLPAARGNKTASFFFSSVSESFELHKLYNDLVPSQVTILVFIHYSPPGRKVSPAP